MNLKQLRITVLFVLALTAPNIHAIPLGGAEAHARKDPLPNNSTWKGELNQRGKDPRLKQVPPKLEMVMIITMRKRDRFAAELHESNERAGVRYSLIYLCKGVITKARNRTYRLAFESYAVKDASKGTTTVTNVPYSATISVNGTEMKGTYRYQNKTGTDLEGEFQLTRQEK